jgi:hypothetical protein
MVAAFEARYRDANASTLLHLRFERALHSGESAILVVTEDISEHNRREQELRVLAWALDLRAGGPAGSAGPGTGGGVVEWTLRPRVLPLLDTAFA